MFNIQLIGVKFAKPNSFGDFNWMCHQNKYLDTLFIFNDNEEYHNTCRGGAGNAIMRKYNKYSNLNKPKSAGIPTGTLEHGGYQSLNAHSVKQIDEAFDEIIELINIFKYKQIYYSSELDGKLGTSIFNVNDKVIKYITNKLFGLTTNSVQIIKIISNDLFEDDFEIDNNCDSDTDTNTDTNTDANTDDN
jgi:hypothetical protein